MIYRNRKLLALAKEVPYCMGCRHPNDGTIVAAHRNEGKGMGIKAPDWAIAFLCHDCHHYIDEGKSPRSERRAIMDRSIVVTLGWIIENHPGVLCQKK